LKILQQQWADKLLNALLWTRYIHATYSSSTPEGAPPQTLDARLLPPAASANSSCQIQRDPVKKSQYPQAAFPQIFFGFKNFTNAIIHTPVRQTQPKPYPPLVPNCSGPAASIPPLKVKLHWLE
jgi:hypothetical protein